MHGEVGTNLVATWTDARADCGNHIIWIRAISGRHGPDGGDGRTCSRALPTRVNRGNRVGAPVRKQDGYAVCGSHTHSQQWIVGNGNIRLRPGLVSLFLGHTDICAVDLSHPSERVGLDS